MEDLKNFEDALMKRLTSSRLGKDDLKKVSSALVSLKKEGFKIDGVELKDLSSVILHTRGIFPPPGGWDFIRKQMDAGKLKRFEGFPLGLLQLEDVRYQFEFEF
ncbi:hypothetical protein SAMN04515674_107169 [Pseudarcicella hirudinis]|uniref:Uncharacterized protein n=1 Tax=Pseudarcicella hirudinis TaxID=1079859 RepID=A0A1I5UGN8_9BACT|nr:hypothetical protein [Pseudarcicella hirudinis]SFP94338.1 hypothetical protein SAMN04515674_107169 [Pseudarcicella hirudinis]